MDVIEKTKEEVVGVIGGSQLSNCNPVAGANRRIVNVVEQLNCFLVELGCVWGGGDWEVCGDLLE